MKILIPLPFLLLIFSAVHSQKKCAAVVNWRYGAPVLLYDKPNGSVIDQIKNDSTTEDFLHLDISDQQGQFFFVSISLTVQKITKEGWIKKADYIGAYVRKDAYPMDLVLYKEKNVSEENKIIVKGWTPVLLTIEKYAEDWAFVSTMQNGKIFNGWILMKDLCANSYSTCN